MKRPIILVLVLITVVLGLGAGGATGANTSGTFLLLSGVEAPDIGVAPNGDEVEVRGEGVFSAHPKTVDASGTFVHKNAGGQVLGSGTWRATELLSFDFYGCRFIPALDVDLGDDTLCGGAVKMLVELDPGAPGGPTLPGILTIFCIIGRQAPASHDVLEEEGATLNIPGVINFNHTDHGDNIFIRL